MTKQVHSSPVVDPLDRLVPLTAVVVHALPAAVLALGAPQDRVEVLQLGSLGRRAHLAADAAAAMGNGLTSQIRG